MDELFQLKEKAEEKKQLESQLKKAREIQKTKMEFTGYIENSSI